MSTFPLSHARTLDPDTSHLAAGQVSQRHAKHVRARLLAAYAGCRYPHGLTAEEAAQFAGFTPRDGAWKRVSDLQRDGLIADTGHRRRGTSGRLLRVLAITAEGRQVAA